MRLGLACLAVAAALIAGVWAWLGSPIAMPRSPLAPGEKLYCVSYSPFRGDQTPLDGSNIVVPPAQIEDDLSRLAKITNCIRTYSVEYGQDKIAGIAAKIGLKVLQGVWLSSHPDKNRWQIDTAVKLANQYPGTIQAVVVGNEVLLRGEMSATGLAAAIRAVKTQVKAPVTYADVWEFWLRNRDLASAVDFITIHILPYWEDDPVPAQDAAAHVESIRQRVVRDFGGKEVLIGEVGWPSAGRMREGALPSPANQARAIQDVLALAKRENFKVNVIEAFDEPWKQALEGTVGGHWGLVDDVSRRFKFGWGDAVSNHPYWKLQAAGGVAFAVLVFGVAFAARRKVTPVVSWLAVTANALTGGVLIGWAVANVPLESLGLAGWLRSLAFCVAAVLTPPVLSAAVVRGVAAPSLARVIGPSGIRSRDPLALLVGILLMAVILLTIEVALGLVFDPRYKDFPFAPLTVAIVPFLTHSFTVSRPSGRCGDSEWAAAAVLALCVLYIVPDESLANWQSLWLCTALGVFAFSLTRVRDAPS